MFHLEKCEQFAKHNIARGSKFCGKYKPPLILSKERNEFLNLNDWLSQTACQNIGSKNTNAVFVAVMKGMTIGDKWERKWVK